MQIQMKHISAKSRMLSGVVVAMVIGLAAASTFAHDGKSMSKGMMSGDMMSKMDTNHDGSISAAEHAAYAESMFDSMDTNHDGMLSKAELDAGMKAMHGEHAKMHGAMDHDNDHDADDMPAATPPKK